MTKREKGVLRVGSSGRNEKIVVGGGQRARKKPGQNRLQAGKEKNRGTNINNKDGKTRGLR